MSEIHRDGGSPTDVLPQNSTEFGDANEASGEISVSPRVLRRPAITALLFGIGALSLFLLGLGKPGAMYWDEPYFVPEARAFLTGTPNPHPEVPPLCKPPLGKLLMAVGMKAAGDNPFGWRVAGAVCGALALVGVYFWTYVLLGDARLAFLAAGLTLFNNFLFVMSRIAIVDAFLMVFLIWSVATYTAALMLDVGVGMRRFLFGCSGVFVGLAGACKWNAIDTLAVLLLVGLALLWIARSSFASGNPALSQCAGHMQQIGAATLLLGMVVAPLVSYSLTYWPLCLIIHRPFGIHELVSMNVFIWHFNSTVANNKFIAAAWYTWPLNLSPQRALSYLVGNPVITWGGLAALGLCLRRFWQKVALPEALVLLLFAANLLQWVVTPGKGTFYYYYYPCVMILGVAIAVAVRSLPPRVFGLRISLLLLVAAIAVFVWCYPRMAHLDTPWDCALGCWS
jgi:dolichyl-phosphate-mannose-protein mannosyltransferase